MTLILTQQIDGPAAWRGQALASDDSWIHQLSNEAIDCLDNALQRARRRGRLFPDMVREDFRLPALEGLLGQIAGELENGRGFLLLRGLPVERYSEEDIRTIYYGIGLNLGQPVTQNPRGDLLGNVMNVGDLNNKHTRVYETNAYLPYHTDPSDVVGLLCLRKARSGGVSSLVSAATVYNEIVRSHPEYLALLYRPIFYAHLGDDSHSPIFSYHDGKLSCRYLRQYIELGHDINNTEVSRVEVDALDLIDRLTHDPALRLDMMLEPGDIQFANNYMIMHSRTAFIDDDDPSCHRKMLRLWLKMANARQLAPDFPGRNGFGLPSAVSVKDTDSSTQNHL